MSTPRSVAAARGVSLFASALPGSSLCLLVCLRVLLAGVLLGFSDSGCSSGWVVVVSFPGLVFCQWAVRPCACCPGLLAGCSCFLPGERFPFCGFVWGSGFPVLLFILLGPDLTLSLSAFLAPASRPWDFTGWGLFLSWLLSWLGLSLAISWWPTYWYPCVSFRFSSGRSFPPSWWGPALLLRWTYFQSILLVCPGHSLLFLALLCILPGFGSLSSQLPVVALVLCFLPCGPAPGLSLYGLLAVSPFLLSRFVAVCFPGL